MLPPKTHWYDPISFGGHRGLGCTDHAFYSGRTDAEDIPVENTVESFRRAYLAGADYVELDAVLLADGQVGCLHNVVPSDHFFRVQPPVAVNELTLAQTRMFPTGREGTGSVARLADVLDVVAELAPRGVCAWAVNIELKGVQGSGQRADCEALTQAVAAVVRASKVPAARVLYSSFALENVIRMALLQPESKFGFLFNETSDGQPVYSDMHAWFTHRYQPFTPENIALAAGIFADRTKASGARLGYVHPELATVTQKALEACRHRSLGCNSWSIFEHLDEARMRLHETVRGMAAAAGVPYSVITDYLTPMKQRLAPAGQGA